MTIFLVSSTIVATGVFPAIASELNTTLSESTGTYYSQLQGGFGFSLTEVDAQLKVRSIGGTLTNLYVYVQQSSTTTLTVTSRKNGANGNLTVSVASGATGAFQDTTHSDSFAAGDLLDAQEVVSGGGIEIAMIAWQVNPASPSPASAPRGRLLSLGVR
jgi:hypothetical protein